jgi:hypothetical protein
MRSIFLILFACSCASTGETYPSTPAPCDAGEASAEQQDAGAPDAEGDALLPGDLCGAPFDAPPCTACGADGLGFVLLGKCYYQCKFADHSCAPMEALNEYCDPICLPPTYLYLQSCVPCVPAQAP